MEYIHSVNCCPSCQSRWVRRRDVSSFERLAMRLTSREPYICDSCGWHGWRSALLAPGVSVQSHQPQTRDSREVDPRFSTGQDVLPCDSIELFETEQPSSRQEVFREHQPESLRDAPPIAATPRVGSPRAPWLTQVLSHARRSLHTVPHRQLSSGMRRYQMKRLKVSRSDAIRFSAIFALGLAAGAFLVWHPNESTLQSPSTDTRSSEAASKTTETRPAESSPPLPSSLPVASVGQIPSVGPTVPSARASTPDRQEATAAADRPAPSRPARQSSTRTPSTAPSTQVAMSTTGTGTSARSRGSLAIVSYPSGARVSVNGRRVGSTPLVVTNMPAGTHLVRIEADGYQAWAWTARVVANQRSRVTAKLYSSATR